MLTLTFGDFIFILVVNLVLSSLVAYFINYAKRRGELSAEEGSSDKEYLKNVLRESVNEARAVLAELRVNEFKVTTGRRRLSRMNTLVEKLSMFDEELGNLVWELVNAPVLLEVISENNKRQEIGTAGSTYINSLTNAYSEKLALALKRCNDLEKHPEIL